MIQERATEAEVSAALEAVLERQSPEQPSLFDKLTDWISERFGVQVLPEVWNALYWTLLAVLVVLGVIFFRRYAAVVRLGRMHRAQDATRGGATVADRVARLRREASEARARGDLRLALRKQFFALVLGLGKRGDLEFRDAWTNRELVARGKPSPEVQAILGPLVRDLEGKEFGHEPVGSEDVDRLEALCQRYLGRSA